MNPKELKYHYHNQTTHTVRAGSEPLSVNVSGRGRDLMPGETIVIEPRKMHYIGGHSDGATIDSEPPWSEDDYFTQRNEV
jgi:quercetin dioxygenase-like cupin family protein